MLGFQLLFTLVDSFYNVELFEADDADSTWNAVVRPEEVLTLTNTVLIRHATTELAEISEPRLQLVITHHAFIRMDHWLLVSHFEYVIVQVKYHHFWFSLPRWNELELLGDNT